MTWKDGGYYGRLCRAITNEAGNRPICYVWTKQNTEHRGGGIDGSGTEPYPQGEVNFRLILQAPKMLEALETIQHQAEHMLDCGGTFVLRANWEFMRMHASAAIAAVKGGEKK